MQDDYVMNCYELQTRLLSIYNNSFAIAYGLKSANWTAEN